MAEPKRRGAARALSGGPPGSSKSRPRPSSFRPRRKHHRGRSCWRAPSSATTRGSFPAPSSASRKRSTSDTIALEIVTSWVTLGALFGSLAGGYVGRPFWPQARAPRRGGSFHHRRARTGLRALTCRSSSFAGSWLASASASPRSPLRSTRRSSPPPHNGDGSSPPISSRSRSVFSSPISSTRRLPVPRAGAPCLGSRGGPWRSPRARRPDRS